MHHEASGPSLKEARELRRERELHHVRIYAGEGATPEAPSWLVEHHSSENDARPTPHEFSDRSEMLAHLDKVTALD
jgi:hypothetical protein